MSRQGRWDRSGEGGKKEKYNEAECDFEAEHVSRRTTYRLGQLSVAAEEINLVVVPVGADEGQLQIVLADQSKQVRSSGESLAWHAKSLEAEGAPGGEHSASHGEGLGQRRTGEEGLYQAATLHRHEGQHVVHDVHGQNVKVGGSGGEVQAAAAAAAATAVAVVCFGDHGGHDGRDGSDRKPPERMEGGDDRPPAAEEERDDRRRTMTMTKTMAMCDVMRRREK